MVTDEILLALLGISGVWLIFLSTAFYWTLRHYRKLTKGVGVEDLKKVLDKILETQEVNKRDIEGLKKAAMALTQDGSLHLQKTGIVRFNPFNETGGNQSFSLAVLDSSDSGFVITGLHARDRTRVYVKTVKKGKSEYDLSTEEKKAIDSARK